MKALARRAVVVFVCAAMLAAQWPAPAWAAAAAEPDPAEAMKYLRSLGVYKDDADPFKTYLGSDEELTPIGRVMYLSLKKRYNAAEEVESMQPVFERLRGNGAYTPARRDGSARAMKLFVEKFGDLDSAPAGSVEESFRIGGLREALMSGAAIVDPPKANAFMQIEVKDGYEFWDAAGLAYRMTKNQVTTYNRELQKNQRQMNLSRPPEVAAIPETGRYNYEMLQYSYWRLKNQETEYVRATRIDRMIALAELLGKNYPTDMWFNEKGLEEDLIRQAKAKTYGHRGKTYSVFDYVDEKFNQRRAYLEGARGAVLRFETDMQRFKASPTITDSQVATMSLNEANALRWLSLAVLETQLFHVKNQGERVDPTAPDAQAIMKIVDGSDLTHDQKAAYKEQGRRMKARLDDLRSILNKTRKALNDADYASSLDTVQAALAATQKELGDLSVDYSIYLEAPSTAFLAKEQMLKAHGRVNLPGHLYNGVSTVARGAYKRTPWGTKYKENMKAIEGGGKAPSMAQTYTDLAALVSKGDFAEARRKIMALNPSAAQYAMSGALGGDASKVNDALRISSSLKANHDRINAVTEVNKTLDAASSFVTWTVSIALMAPVSRASLNMVGKLSGVGGGMINTGKAMTGAGGLARRGVGRSLVVVGEIAKHTAARLESLEPDPVRVKAFAGRFGAGEIAAARYAVAGGARALSVATRQATFTGLSGGISGGFTAGFHLWDIGTKRIGGVNIGGWQAIEPGHTMFSEDWDGLRKAAWAGAKGGAWWANESLDFGWFKAPTASLGFIGLPSTVFGGTRASGFMETIGTRGVVGSASRGARVTWAGLRGLSGDSSLTWSGVRHVIKNGSAAVEAVETAAAASGRTGFLQRWSEAKVLTGKPIAAFGLSMGDNVMKYALFSQAAGRIGEKYSWGMETNVPILHAALDNSEDDLGRRIKKSKLTGRALLESPAWLLIPTYAAHGARDAGPYMHTREGMRQAKESGKMIEVANAYVDKVLKLKPVKPPISQRLFEARVLGRRPASEWIVTKQAKEEAQLYEVRRLANEGGVSPLELMAVRDMTAGKDTFCGLRVTEEVQKFAYEVAIEGLVAQPANALKAISIAPGNTVEGWGRITPERRIEIAKALYHAEVGLGRTLTADVSAKVREVLKDHLLANLPIGEAGKVLRTAIMDLPLESPKLDAAQKEAIETVLAWEANPTVTYPKLTVALKRSAEAKLKEGELSPKEAKALTALYDYILAGDQRFNSFNKTEIVKAQADVIFKALSIEYANRPEMLRMIEGDGKKEIGYRKEVADWAEGRRGQNADAAENMLTMLVSRLQGDLKAKIAAAPGRLGLSEQAALEKALDSVNSSAWVVRDAKGGPIPGWRNKQYVRLMQAFLGEGGHPKFVRTTAESLFARTRAENKGRAKLLSVVDAVEADVHAWAKSRETAKGTAKELAKLEEAGMSALIEKIDARLKESPGELTLKETTALSDLVADIEGLNRQGLHHGILTSGRAGNQVQLYIKAPTSVGKTLLAYEGLLPYLEAEAAASGRKVMFLTFNTKLQAQAEFDFIAYNKLGSTVKFETYEGLKTMVAEGKSKGRNVVEDYLLLQDEMDAAGQQPALTIGMVSGRVTRLNGQTTALNASNADLAWSMNNLSASRLEAAEVQAQRIKTATAGLSDAHVERGPLGAIKTAAEDVLTAVGRLKRARGAAELGAAEKAVEDGMLALLRLSKGLPPAEAEAATVISAALGRMEKAIAERPADNPAIRERLAVEQERTFLNQRRLMDLVYTEEGLARLPAEAGKGRMALESRIENLRKDLAQAEASNSPKAASRAAIIRERIESARVEKSMVERLDGVDASARLIGIDEQIAAIRSGQAPAVRLTVNPKVDRLVRQSAEVDALIRFETALGAQENAPKLAKLMRRSLTLEARIKRADIAGTGPAKPTPKLDGLAREAQALEAGMTAERGAMHQEYRALLERVNALSDKMGTADAGSRAALESQRATARGRLRTIELELSAAPAKGDLGGMLHRRELLSSRAGGTKAARREEAVLRREARAEIMKRFDEAGAHIVKLTREGAPGWDAQVNRLIERRRALQEAYAGDESAMYGAYRNMKESVRSIGENPRLTEKPYEVEGGAGLEPGAALKRADYLIARAREIEAKPRGGGAGKLEGELMKARAEIEGLSAAKESSEYAAATDRLGMLELDLLRADSFHTADAMLGQIDGASFLRFLPKLPKFLWQAATGKLPAAPTEGMGLTRYHAAKMLEALAKDPMMPAHQRDNLSWSYLNSMLLPKGLTGRGSYVRSEIINMVQGFHDSAAGVRVDNRTGKFNVVHNGQWFESMDNASRRWWELEYGTDLTLPYTHNSMSTIKDVTTNKKSYFISLSGTAGDKFEAHLRANKISVVGEGSAMPKNVLLQVVASPEQRLARVVLALKTQLAATRDQAVLRKTDLIPVERRKGSEVEAMGAIEKYMVENGLKPNEPHVLTISEVPGAAAQKFLQGIRDTQKNTGLTVLSVSNTRELRKVERYLRKEGVEQGEIAKVFADTEYLRQNVPEANVLRQMNIEGLNTGRVKFLILDTRVGGRGLDLNFKGERNSTRPGAFRGYTNFEMLVLGPEEMSAVHMVQAMGRIDTGRTLSRAPRRFSLLVDIKTAKEEAVFRDMFKTDPFFVEMRKDPAFQEYARKHGGGIDWNTLNEYVQARAKDGSGEGQLLAQRAEKAVRESLSRRNLEVEENLLRQSNVLTDKPTSDEPMIKHPALERIR